MSDKRVNLPTKGLTDRKASCRVVLWALDTHGPRMVETLGGSTVPDPSLEGEGAPFGSLLETLTQRLTEARDRLITSDRQHRDQKAKTTDYRRMRDDVFAALSTQVLGLRDMIRGAFSPEVIERIGFAIRTPEQPEVLAEQATHLVTRLSDPGLKLEGPRFQSVSMDVNGLAGELAPLASQLNRNLDDVSREERRTEATKVARDEALDDYNREFLWIARTTESLFLLADLPELAGRVRPSPRRSGVTEEVETQGPETSPGEETDTETPDPNPENAPPDSISAEVQQAGENPFVEPSIENPYDAA